jgi:hypothetical protein
MNHYGRKPLSLTVRKVTFLTDLPLFALQVLITCDADSLCQSLIEGTNTSAMLNQTQNVK